MRSELEVNTGAVSGGHAGFRASFARLVEGSNTKGLMLAITAALVILQAALTLQFYWGTDLSAQFRGSQSYRQIAENLTTKGLYSLDGLTATAFRQPLYPLFLAGLMHAFGHNWVLASIVLQASLSVIVGILTVSLSLAVFRSKLAAALAGFLYLIHLGFHLESVSQRETVLFSVLLLLFVYQLTARRRTVWFYPAIFVTAALAYLTRPTGFLLLPILALVIVLEREQLIESREKLISLAAGVLLFSAMTFPYHAYLYREFSRVSPLVPQTTNGLNLFQGNNPATDRIYPYVDVDLFVPTIQKMLAHEGIQGEFGGSQFLKDRAIEYIVNDPLAFGRRAIIKLAALYSPVATPLGYGKLIERDGSVVVSDFKMYLSPENGTVKTLFRSIETAFGVILLIGVIAFMIRLRTWSRYRAARVLLILAPIVLVTAVHIVTFGETRHRLPLDPLLIVLASSYFSSKFQRPPVS
jgi:hypothetical protein